METKMNRASGTCVMIYKRSYTRIIRVPEGEKKVGRSVKVLRKIGSKRIPKYGKTHRPTDSRR